MDSHFNPGYMPPYPSAATQHQPGLGSFGGLSHPQDAPSHTTLPPLQGQSGFQFGNLSYGHPNSQTGTPTTPHPPATSSMPPNSSTSYSHMSPSNPQPGSMLPPSSFNHPYPMTQSMPYPNSTATSLPPPTSIAPGLPSLRPMPPSGLPSLSSNSHYGQQPAFMQNEETPTHVVGSQGRRGILPSAPGRPNAPTQGSAQGGKSMIPQKDADGKYPCPHCNKTYLHAKHLKRHLLRHTGDRPYMCFLCKDTFSRSDILKRHFQKCSIRRGNPTGANHLAHQPRNSNNSNRLSMTQQDGPIGLAGLQEVAGTSYNGAVNQNPAVNGDMSARTSRANSIISPNHMSHRNSMAGMGLLGSNVANNEQMGSSGGLQPGMPAYSMPTSSSASGPVQSNYAFHNPQMNGSVYNGQPQQPQMPYMGQQGSRYDSNHTSSPHQQAPNGDGSGSNVDWSRVFNQGGQDGFMGGQPANARSQAVVNRAGQDEDHVDPLLTRDDSLFGSLYTHAGATVCKPRWDGGGIFGSSNWYLDDPLQVKVDSLAEYCFPDGVKPAPDGSAAKLVKSFLTVPGIKHMAKHYWSFHEHWPMLHMPTFKLAEASNPLLLAMLGIGAIYSTSFDVHQTREIMQFVKTVVHRHCHIYHRYVNGDTEGLGSRPREIEELQALHIIQTMFIWHGEPQQRQVARDEFPVVVAIAKAAGLAHPAPPGHYAYSVLHNGQMDIDASVDVKGWDWQRWLEQEKRNRLFYLLLLTDAASGIYFNCGLQLDPLETRLMLPSDDAAWDAQNAEECASALGLLGPQYQTNNETGTRRPRQPGMREALRTLLEPEARFHVNTTNVYAKFILVHALLTRIVLCRRTLETVDGRAGRSNSAFAPSTPATPLGQNNWVQQGVDAGRFSNSSSQNVTPVNGGPLITAAHREKVQLSQALDKWKTSWDQDMDLQHPPSRSQNRRFGFTKDGVSFFYLGRSFLRSQDAGEWSAPADLRFQHVMTLLKQIKGFVAGKHGTKGFDLGAVGDIHEQYGLDNLTLDMTLLFTPSQDPSTISPIAGPAAYPL